MQLSIPGDRIYFWQWDTQQHLLVKAPECNEVHFTNSQSSEVLTVKVRQTADGQRVADVPNILLQTPETIIAYLHHFHEDDSHTEFEYKFQVMPRCRPSGYVYTETEVLSYSSLDKRVTFLEQTAAQGGSGETTAQTATVEITEVVSLSPNSEPTVTEQKDSTDLHRKYTLGIPAGLPGAQGEKGDQGNTGKDGTSATHSWKGTVLTITSASGTSSADLKGDKGDKGDTGATGPQGIQGIQGNPGTKGDKGDKGDKGATGAQGEPGKDGVDGTIQNVPLYAESSDWLAENGDTTKVYVLPDGYIWAYFYKEGTGPAYTNRLPLATDADRTTILNGVGYVDGYRINSSGEAKALSGCQASGYIPVVQGDIIRIKNLQTYVGTKYNHMIAFYNSANTYVGSTYLNPTNDMSGWADNQPVGVTLSSDKAEVTINTANVSGITACNAFRFMGTNMANVIVTVNEEIAEGGSAGGYGWYSTGHAFVPADYEDRIIALEKKVNTGLQSTSNVYLESRNVYSLPVPSGYCESHVEYNATATHYLSKYDFATMTTMFTALATENPDYVTETVLGKDASGAYDIKQYVLDAPSVLSSGYTSAIKREKPVFIITSGLHGVEPDAVHSVYHFMKDLCQNHMESEQLEYLHNNVKFVIVPISNPWGYVNQNYHNSNDVDLNKNFEYGYQNDGTDNTGTAAYSESETALLKGVFDTYKNAVFHLECHGKHGVDTAFAETIWFSLMQSLGSELIELCADTITKQIGRRLYKLGYATDKSAGGYITYYGLNGRPKDYTGTKYGILSATMEGTGCIYGETGYSVNTQKINCEALENFVLRVMDALDRNVGVQCY